MHSNVFLQKAIRYSYFRKKTLTANDKHHAVNRKSNEHSCKMFKQSTTPHPNDLLPSEIIQAPQLNINITGVTLKCVGEMTAPVCIHYGGIYSSEHHRAPQHHNPYPP